MLEQEIDALIRELTEGEIPLHSVAVIYKGELIHEQYMEPFQKHELHRMYSVTKSLVSLAIGLLCSEGKLKLEDPIVSYFPEYVPKDASAWLTHMTIEHMLKMQTCHEMTTYKKHLNQPWVPGFFTTSPHHAPGMMFHYDTSSSHVLCALVERLSGMEIMEYLRRAFLDEIGWSQESYIIRNKFDEAMGGSGLMAKTEDMVKLAKLLMADGMWNKRQLLPKAYLEDAVSFQTSNKIKGGIKEEQQGYGYQFWRLTHDGYGCYGMGGQFILCYPRYQLAIVTTADTMGIPGGNQMIYNCLYRNLFPVMENPALPRRKDNYAIADRRIPWGQWYVSSTGMPFAGMAFCPDGILYRLGEKIYRLPISWNQDAQGSFPVYGDPCVTDVQWLDERTLYLKTRFLGENLASYELQVVFGDGEVTCYQKNTQEVGYREFEGWFIGKGIEG